MARRIKLLLLILVVAMLLGGFAIHVVSGSLLEADSDPATAALRQRLTYLLLIGACGTLLIFPMALPALRAMSRRVGTSGQHVHLRLEDGRELRVAPSDLPYTGRALMHGQWSFPLRNQQGKSFYADDEIETRLEPLLDPTRALTPWQGLRHQWRYRDALLLWPLASVVALLLLLLLALSLQPAAPLP